MKPYIDMFLTVQNEFLTSRRMKSRLLKNWGTTTINGVPVFNKMLIVWHKNIPNLADNPSVSKILTMFGAKKAIKEAKYEGLDYYYFYFNKKKWAKPSDLSAEVLCNKINSFIPLNEPFDVDLNVTESSKENLYSGWTASQVETYMRANWSTLVDQIYLEAKVNGISEQVVGTYVLFDTEGIFDVKVTKATVVGSPVYAEEGVRYRKNKERLITGYVTNMSLSLTITRKKNITPESVMYQKILEEKNQTRQNTLAYLEASDKKYKSVADMITRMTSYNSGDTDEVWYKGHLRVAAADSNYLKRNDFTKLVGKTIDTGYKQTEQKKKGGFLGALISIVVVVIAVVLTPWTGGASLALLSALAVNLGIAALVLTALSMVMAKAGYEGAASFMGKVAMVAGIISTIAGVGAALQTMVRTAAQAVTQQTLMQTAQQVGKWALEQVAGTWVKALSTASKVLDMVTSRVHGNKVDKLESRLGALKGEVLQQEQELAEIADKEYHIGVEDIKMYSKPLSDDNLQFEVDYLYEGTKMNIGRPSFMPYGLNTRMKFNEYSGKFE